MQKIYLFWILLTFKCIPFMLKIFYLYSFHSIWIVGKKYKKCRLFCFAQNGTLNTWPKCKQNKLLACKSIHCSQLPSSTFRCEWFSSVGVYQTLSFMCSCFGERCMPFDHQFFSRICTPNLGVSVAPVRQNS